MMSYLIFLNLFQNLPTISTMIYFYFYRSTRLATFPDYLMIQLKKFTFDDKWSPIKLDVEVEVCLKSEKPSLIIVSLEKIF